MLKLTPPDAKAFVPTSVLLQRLHDEAPPDRFTLDWVMRRLHRRGFGLILLLLALVAIAPGVSIVAGLLLMIPVFPMIAGRPAPVFPRERWIGHFGYSPRNEGLVPVLSDAGPHLAPLLS